MPTWLLLAFLGAFGQALSWAVEKQSLQTRGINNTLGVISYMTAGLILLTMWGLTSSNMSISTLSGNFWKACLIAVVLNVVAAWCAFKALDLADYSKLIPLIATTALLIVPLEYLLLGVRPVVLQVAGICIIVLGGIVFSFSKRKFSTSPKALLLFSTTLFCYALTSTYMAVMVSESKDALLAGALMHLGISLGFILMWSLAWKKERSTISRLGMNNELVRTMWLLILTGVIIALFENGPILLALQSGGTASEVFSIKRLMPIFALLIGVYWLKEPVTKKQVIGAILMIIGAILIIRFKP